MPLRLWAGLVGIVAVMGLLTWSHSHAYQAGRSAERQAVLSRSIEILRERNRVDDEVSTMDDPALCSALGGVWMPDDSTCQ